MLLTAKIGEKN